jgi:hypothetical protein
VNCPSRPSTVLSNILRLSRRPPPIMICGAMNARTSMKSGKRGQQCRLLS